MNSINFEQINIEKIIEDKVQWMKGEGMKYQCGIIK